MGVTQAKRLVKLLIQKHRAFRLAGCKTGADIAGGVRFEYANKIHLGAQVRIAHGALLRANTQQAKGINIGDDCSLLENTALCCNQGVIELGQRVWLGQQSIIYGNGNVKIGDDVLIATRCCINTVSHQYQRCDISINQQPIDVAPITIENDVWIGIGATLLQGIHVGEGAIIGAHSLGNRDVPAWSVVCGTPARVVSSRLTREVA